MAVKTLKNDFFEIFFENYPILNLFSWTVTQSW